ncbi:hypothetical protein ACRYCC_39455 [Actinomadura scrupuli]|uniref:hypothetical protein n=1 Tax=Actinomadura scrupuli TaxID=559629 RepID=UPI003D98F3EF
MSETGGHSDKEQRIRDGRYEGGDGKIFVVLRVDTEDTGVVSGDVYRMGPSFRDYVASVRTAPGLRIPPYGGHWAAEWLDGLGAATTGTLGLTAAADSEDTVTLTLRADRVLNGVPQGRDLVVTAALAGSELRELGIEVEKEDGVRLPGPVAFPDHPDQTLHGCLRAAGFAVSDAGDFTEIPRSADGWALSQTFTVLNDLMSSTAQAQLSAPDWQLHLLMLSRSTRDGLLGVMFDASGVLQRQGVAIFVDEIRGHLPDDVEDRKILQTTVHELGHALNLAHRFEREVGRADSTSFMNYDWRYRGGGHTAEFWERFAFTFDPDEREFLRHAPKAAVVPGGAPFHSIRYWADGTGGYSPYLPEVPVPGFKLTLTPPAAGPLFAFGQPVFLEITLENATPADVTFPAEVLDPKAGILEILIRRRSGSVPAAPTALTDAMPFTPIMQRCFDQLPGTGEVVRPGGRLRNNLNLTFGSGGFPFPEPGDYDIVPLLNFPSTALFGQQIDQIIAGTPLRIRVAHPQSLEEERDAMVLLRPDVGAWFALGGSDCLGTARDALEEVRDRREAVNGPGDAVAAAIVRAAGLDAARPSVRYRDGRFTESPGDPERAAALLESLDAVALRAFDRHTAEHTMALARTLPG